jgi:hypothetical protein
VTVRFNPEKGDVEIRCLSRAEQQPYRLKNLTDRQFQAAAIQKGVLQLKSNTHDRGAFPFDVGVYLLGFGGYR